jgi:osmotically-inducible protein OsmY
MAGRWSKTIFLGSLVAMLAACSAARSVSFDDARIAEEIKGAIHEDHIDEVTVSVKNRRVTLEGIVDSQEQSDQARRDAERIDGVVAVSNQIRVRTRARIAGASSPR